MMTPKEVQEHGFTRSRKGYDMAEVDEFLDKLTEDYTALYTNYGKLSSSYAKLRKKAQALAAALEQVQQQSRKMTAVTAAPAAPVQQPSPSQAAVVASQAAVDELLRTARKDAEAIRAGAERERQEIINQATDYAAENVDRLKAEVAAEEQRLATLKKNTAAYTSQVRQLIARQTALLDSMPVHDDDFAAAPAPVAVEAVEAPAAPLVEEADEPTVRVEETEASLAEEISRNMMNLRFADTDDDDTRKADAFTGLDDTGSLFDAIANSDGSEFDEE